MASQGNEVSLPLKVVTDGEGKVRALAGEFERLQRELIKTAEASDVPGLAEQAAQYGEIGARLRQVADEQAGIREITATLREMAGAGQLSQTQVEGLAADLDRIGSNRAAIVQLQALEAQVTEADVALARQRTTLNQSALALDDAKARAGQYAQAVAVARAEVDRSSTVHQAAKAELGEFRTQLNSSGKATAEQRDQLQALNLKVQLAKQQLGGAKGELKAVEGAQKAANKETDALARQFERQSQQVDRAQKAQAGYSQQLTTSRAALERMGITANNVAGIERELVQSQEALRQKMLQVAQLGQARDLLGVRSHDEIQREIKDTIAAYNTLKASGMLSQRELAQAALQTETRIRELERQTRGWADALGQAKGEIAAVAASAAGFVLAGREAISFESAMANVAKVVDGTDDQLQLLAASIKGMSRELPLSAVELAKIAEAGGQLGIPISKMEQFIALAAKMGTAFGISAEQAGQAVGQLTTIFGLPLDGIEQLANALNVLGNNTAATEKGLLDFLVRVGGSAKQFGLTAEQVSALGATFLAMGKTPEVAGTAVNALLQKLQTANVQSDGFKQTLAGLGLSAEQLAVSIRDNPQAALDQFLGTLENLDPQRRAETLAQLFGLEYADDIAALTGSLGEYRKALGAVSDAQQQAGSLENEFQKRVQTTEAQLQLLKNAVQEAAINFGSTFLPAVSAAAKVLADATGAVADFINAHPGISLVAGSVVALTASINGLKLAALAARVAFRGMTGTAADDLASLVTKVGLSEQALGRLKGTVGLVGAAFAGWEIGTYLRENFVEVEQFGIALAGGLHEIVENIRYANEMIAATLTGDTWEEATRRHEERLAEIQDRYAEMFNEAANRGSSLAEANQRAAQSAEQLAAASGHAADQVNAVGSAATGSVPPLAGVAAGADQAAGKLGELGSSADAVYQNLIRIGPAAVASGDGVAKLQQSLQSLSAADLIRLQIQLQGSNDAAGKFDSTLQAIVDESLRRLGLESSQVFGGLSQQATSAIGAFDALRDSGRASADGLKVAFDAAMKAADSSDAVDELRARLQEMGKQGVLSADEVRARMLQLEVTAQQVAHATDDIGGALQRLGVQSKAELGAMAAQLRDDVNTAIKSGLVSTEQLGQAMNKAYQAAVAAGDGFTKAWLELQAPVHGVKLKLDQVAEAAAGAGEAGQGAGDQLAAGMDKARQAIEATSAAYGQASWRNGNGSLKTEPDQSPNIEGRLPGTDENSKGFGRSAGGMNWIGIVNWLKGAGLDEQRARDIANEFVDGKGQVIYSNNPGQKKYSGSTLTEALSNAIYQEAQRGKGGNGGLQQISTPKPTPAPATNSPALAAPTSHTVTISLGGRSRTVNTASASDASALTSLLRELEDAAGRS